MQQEDLYRHYRAFYAPNNAVLALAGDFESGAMLARLQQLYESIPAGEAPPRLARPEPPQNGERRVTVEGPGETIYVEAAYHTPQATHADFMACVALDSLLSGPSSLNLFGAGLSNKTSRLYRALVESELAIGVSGGLQATIDPYLHSITVIVHPTSTPERTMVALDEEIRRIQESPPTNDELAQAVKQAQALFAYSSESITNQAYWLGLTEMFASYEWFENFLPRLAAVKPEDVQRVAQTYLRPQNRVVGTYLPTSNGSAEED
jgi:zinc protease